MIYEIFKQMFGSSDAGWPEFAGAVIVSVYAVWLLAWVCSWVYQYSVSYVFDGAKKVPLPASRLVSFLGGAKFVGLVDGWYFSKDIGLGNYWRHTRISCGVIVQQRDTYDGPTQDATKWSNTSGFLFFKGWDTGAIIAIAPLIFSLVLLVADRFPALACCVLLYFALLTVARTTVRLATKLTTHINDKSLHKEEK